MVNALLVVVVVLGLLLLGTWLVLYQIVKQQGRLVLRMDSLEHQGLHDKQIAELPKLSGLSVGTQLPTFDLPNLRGGRLSLAPLRGQQVLLVNWSPNCGYCERIAPDLAQLKSALRTRKVQLVLAAHGAAEANRELASRHRCSACPI